jgi:hypothetical protein
MPGCTGDLRSTVLSNVLGVQQQQLASRPAELLLKEAELNMQGAAAAAGAKTQCTAVLHKRKHFTLGMRHANALLCTYQAAHQQQVCPAVPLPAALQC